MHSLSVHYNRQERTGINLYAFAQDIAGEAGLLGVSTAPFDWGVPSLSFSSISSVRDTTPSSRTDQTFSIGDSIVKTAGHHALRFGADYRHVGFDSRSDNNPRGSYVFTGLYTGLDLADYLLGLPQQTTVQFGAGVNAFSASSFNAYLQDDWRLGANVTLNAGVRYEYQSPYSEGSNHLVTLDIDPTFSAATPVQAGQTGPYYGEFPDTIVTADGNNFAPRVGVAWRARKSTVVRAGYGINYSTSAYPVDRAATGAAAALQHDEHRHRHACRIRWRSRPHCSPRRVSPPTTSRWIRTSACPGSRSGTSTCSAISTRTLTMNVAYVGTRGSSLEIVRAPNRSADGLTIQGVSSFYYETSQGQSIMHGLTLRLRKRLTKGFAAGGSYTFSKSIDNASSIGGSGTVVAQNDQDLAAERGLSSFDQRHRFAANMTWQLPFGSDGRWAQHGLAAAVLGGWSWNMNLQLSSGTPFTARVLGSTSDVANGVNGTLRADTTGQKVTLDHPTTAQFFNTAAFILPGPGEYGTAGRNTIIGPGVTNLNGRLSRNIPLGGDRALTDRDDREQPLEHRAMGHDRYRRQLADLRSGHCRAGGQADAGACPLPVLTCHSDVSAPSPSSWCSSPLPGVGLRGQSIGQRPPAFKASTELVLVNVVVRDRSGAVVRGLTKDDFTISEDGKTQVIQTFDAEDLGTSPDVAALDAVRVLGGALKAVPSPSGTAASGAPAAATTPPPDLRGRRLVVLFFDLSSMQTEELERAVVAARDYLTKQLSPADLVAIASFSTALRRGPGLHRRPLRAPRRAQRVQLGAADRASRKARPAIRKARRTTAPRSRSTTPSSTSSTRTGACRRCRRWPTHCRGSIRRSRSSTSAAA